MRMRLTRYPVLWLYRADILLFILAGYIAVIGSSFVFFYKASNNAESSLFSDEIVKSVMDIISSVPRSATNPQKGVFCDVQADRRTELLDKLSKNSSKRGLPPWQFGNDVNFYRLDNDQADVNGLQLRRRTENEERLLANIRRYEFTSAPFRDLFAFAANLELETILARSTNCDLQGNSFLIGSFLYYLDKRYYWKNLFSAGSEYAIFFIDLITLLGGLLFVYKVWNTYRPGYSPKIATHPKLAIFILVFLGMYLCSIFANNVIRQENTVLSDTLIIGSVQQFSFVDIANARAALRSSSIEDSDRNKIDTLYSIYRFLLPVRLSELNFTSSVLEGAVSTSVNDRTPFEFYSDVSNSIESRTYLAIEDSSFILLAFLIFLSLISRWKLTISQADVVLSVIISLFCSAIPMGVGSFIFNRFKASEFGAPTVLYEHDAYIISLDSTIQLFIMSSLMVSIIALVTFYLTNNNLRASYIGAVVYLSVGMFISTLILKGIKPAQYPWLLFIVLFVALAVIDEVLDRLVIRKLDIPRRY